MLLHAQSAKMPSEEIRVVLAEVPGLMRDGLRALLDRESDILVVGNVSDLGTLVATVTKHQPHVLVLGEALFRKAGPELTKTLEELTPHVEILALTGTETSSYALIEHVRALGHSVASGAPGWHRVSVNADALQSLLSPRETEVLRLIASGYTNQEAAQRFGISVKTVEGYRARVMRKLGVRGRAGLVRVALACGLLSPHDDD